MARNPKDAAGYAGLGAAYFQRARETGDVSDYQLAEESLTKSLDLVSADFSADAALGTMAEVCMGEHRFADALTYAQKALSLGTGDVSPFAIVGDAYADMGEYDKAAACLWPVDAARHDAFSACRVCARQPALLSQVHRRRHGRGDQPDEDSGHGGSRGSASEREPGMAVLRVGRISNRRPATPLRPMRPIWPHSTRIRETIALWLRWPSSGRTTADMRKRSCSTKRPLPSFPCRSSSRSSAISMQSPETRQRRKSNMRWSSTSDLLGHINQVLHNRDLALFYADHDMKLAEALDLAQKELEVRHDVYTWDALAWALYKNGKLTEAAKASEKAMRFGTRDSLLLFHAGMIAEALGQREQARSELKRSARDQPAFPSDLCRCERNRDSPRWKRNPNQREARIAMLAKRSRRFLSLLLLLGLCRSASAHPMGNFSVNHYSKITWRATGSAFGTSSIWRRFPPIRNCSRRILRRLQSIRIPRQ